MSSTILCWDTAVNWMKFQPSSEGQIKSRHTPLYNFSQMVFPSDTLPFYQKVDCCFQGGPRFTLPDPLIFIIATIYLLSMHYVSGAVLRALCALYHRTFPITPQRRY